MADGLPYVLPDSVTIPDPGASSSSGYGMSFWLPFLTCPRRAYLERTTGRGFSMEDEDGNRKVDRYNRPKLNQTKIGILFHKILEHYHAHDDCSCAFRYDAGEDDLEWQEALRYFAVYKPQTPAGLFGQIVECEEPFAIGSHPASTSPEPGDKKWALDLFGIPFFTGRRDMRSIVADANQVTNICGMGGFDILPGDCIIIDTKTKAREDQTLMAEMMESAQFHAYMMAARALGLPCKGTIANVVIGTKEIKIRRWFVPYPTERQQQVVKEMLTQANWNRENLGEQHANPRHCYDYFKLCTFYMQECDRTNPGLGERLVNLRRTS